MGLFGKLIALTIDTITLPIDAANDVVTLGGSLTDEDSAIAKKMRKLQREVDELADDE